MAQQVLECGICLEDIRSKRSRPCSIDETPVCYDCMKESILPMFQAALEYEHQYPPRFGSKKLEINDFLGLLSRHYGIEFVERYVRREIEYAANIRVYCKNLVTSRSLPAVGGVCKRGITLALTPGMVEVYKAAGHTQTECGGFVSRQIHAPQTILECERCNGKLCGACEEPVFMDIKSHSKSDIQPHTCRAVHRADTLQDILGQIRGYDLQQCPNIACRNIIALSSGCNHLVCPRCSTNFCYICGQEVDPDGDHWTIGKPCPRWNQPGSQHAQHDEPEAPQTHVILGSLEELTFNDQQWGAILRQLRFVVMYRVEDDVGVEHEWVLQALLRMPETEGMSERELQNPVMRMFPLLDEVGPRPPRAPGEFVPVRSPRGTDEVAQRAIDWIVEAGRGRELPQAFYANLVQELEHRELQEDEFTVLEEDLRPVIQSIIKSYGEGLFELRTVDASLEITAWAMVNGHNLDDEAVMRLLRMYDNLVANLEFVDRDADTDPGPEEIEEFESRHGAIMQEAQRNFRELIDGTLPELKEKYDDYIASILVWE